MSAPMRSHTISTIKLPVDDQVVMLVIHCVASQSSFFAYVHGRLVFVANPFEDNATSKNKRSKYWKRLIISVKHLDHFSP